MKVAIMQPYFFPYIGYFQLIHSVDTFVIYDNIEYTKKGWLNRNRFLQNGRDAYFTIPLQKDSDYLHVVDRRVAENFNKTKLLNTVKEAYRKAPYFYEGYSILEKAVLQNEANLYKYIHTSVMEVLSKLELNTRVITSSSIKIDHSLRSQDKVIAICRELGATAYHNSIGGVNLYSSEEFTKHDIELKFIKSKPIQYKQFDHDFVPWLSILDLIMFNDRTKLQDFITHYEVLG